MGFKCGIVGLPNVGKSTLFNALTNSNKAQAENFPFCTIDPNIGIVAVPDERLDKLAEISISKKKINTTISFVDIAGLVGSEMCIRDREYSRVRIGIGKPENKTPVSDYVLNDFNEDEQVHLNSITSNIIESLTILIDKKLDLFSSTVNNN